MENFKTVPLEFTELSADEMLKRSKEFCENMKRRRSVRLFSDRPVAREIIENCIRTASTAPSGNNCQPWHFAAVSDPAVKKLIRQEAEKVEAAFYTKESNQQWVGDLSHLGTGPSKPFLEQAPYLIVVFSKTYGLLETGQKETYYYVPQSVGIAVGFLITAIHNAGLACLPYTPAPATFLSKVLNRPENERAFCVLPVGHPAKGVSVPVIEKKPLDEVSTFV